MGRRRGVPDVDAREGECADAREQRGADTGAGRRNLGRRCHRHQVRVVDPSRVAFTPSASRGDARSRELAPRAPWRRTRRRAARGSRRFAPRRTPRPLPRREEEARARSRPRARSSRTPSCPRRTTASRPPRARRAGSTAIRWRSTSARARRFARPRERPACRRGRARDPPRHHPRRRPNAPRRVRVRFPRRRRRRRPCRPREGIRPHRPRARTRPRPPRRPVPAPAADTLRSDGRRRAKARPRRRRARPDAESAMRRRRRRRRRRGVLFEIFSREPVAAPRGGEGAVSRRGLGERRRPSVAERRRRAGGFAFAFHDLFLYIRRSTYQSRDRFINIVRPPRCGYPENRGTSRDHRPATPGGSSTVASGNPSRCITSRWDIITRS